MFADINQTLLRHLATSTGAAYNLRARSPQVLRDAEVFVSARNDVKRLDAAQTLAADILRKNDFDEMIALRDLVARQELRRQIKYPRQQDHTAHTVSLYLLGLWLYDNLPKFQSSFAGKIEMQREPLILRGTNPPVFTDSLDHEFLFQWLYASLLHDIGYVFYDLSSETYEDRRAIDELFSWKHVRSSYGELSAPGEKAVRGAYDEWQDHYATTNSLTSFSENAVTEVIEYLAYAPWLGDLLPSREKEDLFSILEMNDSPLLREYALEVAQTGYVSAAAGKGPLDHAVGSGLFLLRYTAFWYWLTKHVQDNAPKSLQHATSGFSYDLQNLEKSIIPACRAVAFHNIQPTVSSARKIIPLITLREEPLTFLSVLCDELQIWDRPPAGLTHLSNYREYAKSALDGDDIEIVCDGPRSRAKAVMTIRANSEVRERVEERIHTALERLPGWGELIRITVTAK